MENVLTISSTASLDYLIEALEENNFNQFKRILSAKCPNLTDPTIGDDYLDGIFKILAELDTEGKLTEEKYTHLLWLVMKIDFTPRTVKIAEYLIKHGADVNSRNSGILDKYSIIWEKIYQGSLEWTEFLLKNGAVLWKCADETTDFCISYPVYATFYNRYPSDTAKKMLSLFFRYGLDPAASFRGKFEWSNLLIVFIYFSCFKNHRLYDNDIPGILDIAEFLIDNGAPVNGVFITDGLDFPTLHFVTMTGNVELVNFLIKKGADVNLRNECFGIAPLHLATQAPIQNKDIMEDLVLAGAVVNVQAYNGQTPLHMACQQRLEMSIEFLIQNGSDIFTIDNFGETAVTFLSDESGKYVDDKCGLLMMKIMAKLSFDHYTMPNRVNLDYIMANPKAQEHFDNYKKEFLKMSTNKLNGICSYYAILNMSLSVKKLANFLRTEKIDEDFKNFNNLLVSPYGDDLKKIYDNAILIRDEFLEIESRVNAIFKFIFPDVVLRNITKYLKIRDLPLA